MIVIVDYGAGNLRSVQNTLDEIGATYRVTNQASGLDSASKVILPGVGHFGQMMRALDSLALRQPILDVIGRGVPFLGICLGLQAMFERSTEAPEEQGLALFPGHIERFGEGVRVPHMGWNNLEPLRSSRLLDGLGAEPFVYFAHSYYAPVTEQTAATCRYSVPYTAILEHRNVYGVQFHPEKSGPVGLKIVRNFVEKA
jgi:imidazole glycerol-phosphate synthase subunit HisH